MNQSLSFDSRLDEMKKDYDAKAQKMEESLKATQDQQTQIMQQTSQDHQSSLANVLSKAEATERELKGQLEAARSEVLSLKKEMELNRLASDEELTTLLRRVQEETDKGNQMADTLRIENYRLCDEVKALKAASEHYQLREGKRQHLFAL